jgi:hypothetical protein
MFGRKQGYVGIITLLALGLGAGLAISLGHRTPAAASASAGGAQQAITKQQVMENYGKLPLSFEPNQGQADKAVQFLSRGNRYTLFLTGHEAVMTLRNDNEQSGFLKLKLVGAQAEPPAEGQQPLAGKSNYLIGNDRSKWQTDVPNYASVKYREVWPGVDMVWYGNQRTLEYDFIVQPGVNPQQIKLAFAGASALRLDEAGNLVLTTRAGEITQKAPVIYQESASGRETVTGKYVLQGACEVAFELGAYDVSRPLVIDPQLVYSTYVGGNSNLGGSSDDVAFGIAVDDSGQAFLTGQTLSANFPVTSTLDPNADAITGAGFVTKLNAAGTGVVYSTIIGGGSGIELDVFFGTQFNAIALTADGKACVTGFTDNLTNRSDYPVTANAFQKNGPPCFNLTGVCSFTPDRLTDAVVTVLNAQGNGLVYSTFYGGSTTFNFTATRANDAGLSVAVDAANRVYISGLSTSNNLPMKNGFQNNPNSSGDGKDAFIAVFDPSIANGNDTLLYASYLGGSGDDFGKGIAVDNNRNAYVVGSTSSNNLATKAPAGQTLPPLRASFGGGATDGFVAKISTNASGASSLTYLTYFGGNGNDVAEAVAVDSAQRAYLTGTTGSSPQTFPLLNAFDNVQNNDEAFVAKLNADGTALFYSSFLGGTNAASSQGGFEEGRGIALDAAGNAYVVGRTSAGATFPAGLIPAFPTNLQGTAFLTVVEASVSTTTVPRLFTATTFGGNGAFARAVAVDAKGDVYLAGSTTGNLPTTAGAFQPTFNGGPTDGFVAKISVPFPDTIGVFRESAQNFFLRNSNTAGSADITVNFGLAGDIPLAGDWDGDGDDDVGVFRAAVGQFILKKGFSRTCLLPPCTITLFFGQAGDKPIAGDWNGDGIDTVGVARNGQFLLTNGPNTNNTTPAVDFTINFGLGTDVPVVGDWDGNGIDTPGVFRDGFFFLTNGINGQNVNNTAPLVDINAIFGQIGDLPVIGDWDGDGVDTLGVFSNLTNFTLSNRFDATGAFNVAFGQTGDRPVAGDWNRLP